MAEMARLFRACREETGSAYVAARQEFLALGPAAALYLREQLAGEDWRSRLTAEVLLGWLEQPQVYGLVLEDVTAFWLADQGAKPVDEDPSIVRRAELLAGYQEDVVPRMLEILTKSLEYGDGVQLQAIVLALDYLRDSRAAEPLAELALGSDDAGVQALALAALGSLGEPVGEAVARAILADSSRGPLVHQVAAMVFGQAGR